MNRRPFYVLLTLLSLLTLWALDDILQYWNAKPAEAVVQAVEQRKKQIGDNFAYWFTTYSVVAWDEDGIDRRAYLPHPSNGGRGRAVAPPYVGMTIPIVYVASKPHLVRRASTQRDGRYALRFFLLVGWLFAWLEWRGKIPDRFYQSAYGRKDARREDRSWRGEAWLKWHGKITRDGRGK